MSKEENSLNSYKYERYPYDIPKLDGATVVIDPHDQIVEPIVIPKRIAPLVSEKEYKNKYRV